MLDLAGAKSKVSETTPQYRISRSSKVTGPRLCTLLFSSAHMFLVQFRSGIWVDYVKRLILWSLNHLCVDLDTCFEASSCWKIQLWLCCSFFTIGTRFSLKVSSYLCLSMSWCLVSLQGSPDIWTWNLTTDTLLYICGYLHTWEPGFSA